MLSTIERDFALNTIKAGQRCDKRDPVQRRPIKFTFESELGCCLVDIGSTKVMAQISWDLAAPKDSRPHDGILKCNVELSMLAHPRFEMSSARHHTSAQLSRLLEKCICESRCLDLESLCLEAGLKVMRIRVDVHALNDDGNLIGAMCLAAIAAMCHFKRPDVSFSGGEVTIHKFAEKDPLSLTLLHIPICSNFVYIQGHLLLDPTITEQRISDASITVACNKFREICLLQVSGETVLLPDQVLKCVKLATVEANQISDILRKALDNDVKQRLLGETTTIYPTNLSEKVNNKESEIHETLKEEYSNDSSEDIDVYTEEIKDNIEPQIKIIHDDVIQVGLGGDSKWNKSKQSLNKISTANITNDSVQKSAGKAKSKKKNKKNVTIKNDSNFDGSEEEETVLLVENDESIDMIDLSIALKKPSKFKKK